MINRRDFLQSLPLLASAPAQTPADEKRMWLKPRGLAPWDGQLGFTLDPPVPEWHLDGAETPDHAAFTGGPYRLDLTLSHSESGLLTLQFKLERIDRQPFKVRGYSAKVQLSLLGIYRVWNYRGGPIELMEEFDTNMRGLASGKDYSMLYGANSGIPILICADREGRNRFTFGMRDQVEATGLRIGEYSMGLSTRGEGLNFSFEFSKPVGYEITRTSLADGAWLDIRRADWFTAMAQYTRWVESTSRIPVLKPPAAAYEPIWNTWYPFGQNINEKIISESAEFCRKLGIPTLCLDAGYNNALTAGMGTPEEIESFNSHTGDWTADPTKFPDFPAHVERLHAHGHRITVWVALFIVGKDTRAYPAARHMLMHDASGKEQAHLCSRHPDTPGYLARTFLKLAKDYDLDGFWLDFMDNLHVACHSSHPHANTSTGEGYNHCLAAVRDAVLAWKPQFLIETRMKMANINVKQFVNVLETTDMPFDFDLNRSLGVVVRSFSGGLAVKLDPVQWHIHESAENVAKSCATVTLTGVPVFGVDFRLLPESHLRVVAAWMRYYRQHQHELSLGQFAPTGFAGLFPQFSIHSGLKAFLYVGSSSVAPSRVTGCHEVHIINASDADRLTLVLDGLAPGRWRAVVRDCFLEQTRAYDLSVSSRSFLLDQPIPQGGLLELHDPVS